MSIVGTAWHPRGPSPIIAGNQRNNGRTNAIAVHPGNDQIAYAGAAGGGVWKTDDGGAHWRPLFDRQPSLGNGQISLAIGEPAAVAIDPTDPDVIYAGTGPRKIVSNSATAAGLFKSTDGGASWVLLGSGYPADNTGNAATIFGTTGATLINSIIVDPANSSVVYLASSTGVWRSANGGLDWTLGTGSPIADARSLVLDRSSRRRARILYAGISKQGVFQSTDGGQSWTQILSTTTPAVAAALAAVPGAAMGQVVLDLAPPASPPAAGGIQVIYIAIAGNTKALDPVGLFVSTDQGRTWSQQAASGMSALGSTQLGFCMALAVDPASPGDGANDVLFLGCVGQGRSTDSGQNFTQLAGLHADTHAWGFFSPPAPAPTIVYCVTDGGVWRSGDDGVSFKSRNEGGLQTTLIYNLDIKPDATASESAAAFQDNGSKLAGPGPSWRQGLGGDGFDIVYSGTTPTWLMASKNRPNNKGIPQSQVLFSDDDGATWADVTPFASGGSDAGLFKPQLAADPSSADVFYATGVANLYQTQNAGTTGTTWRILTPISALRNFSFGAAVAVAPTDGNSVVVASGQPTVLVSTNALGSAPTFTNITRNLPGRPVLRVAFDPNDATVIYAVLGGFAGTGPPGHVFRTTLTAASWTDISPDLDAPFGALALDGQDTPTTIYVGTDVGGVLRSVDLGASWTVLDDLRFPRAPVTDLVIGRGSQVLQAATFGRGVFEFIRPDWPSIAVNPEAEFDFGTTCGDEIVYRTLEVFNVGTSAPLVITSVQRLMGSTGFEVSQSPGTPLEVRPGEHVDFTVGFSATTPGATEKATIRIVSNDPDAPTVDLIAIGLGGTPALKTVIADHGAFGSVCVGEFADRDLVLNNSGQCPLHIRTIRSTSTAFQVPRVVSYPLTVAPGGSVAVPIRFQPPATGPAVAVLQIDSDDPASPALVHVSGTAPAPRLAVSIADTGAFPDTCLGDISDETLTLSNSGRCALTVTAITSSSTDFLVPETLSFPVVIAPGGDLDLTLRFQPAHIGDSTGTVTIVSDDPESPATLDVSGHTPSGRLTITGTADFGPVLLGDHARQTLSICNTGDCDLHVTRVAFRPPSPCDTARRSPCGCAGCARRCGCGSGCGCAGGDDAHPAAHGCACDQKCLNFRILANPFPATVHPGSCLGVLLEYVPTCGSAACCELVIESDDPDLPQRTILVTGCLRRTLRSALKCWAAQELHEILEAGNC
jgi:photosystem II stability/assembly factor-like uncharacterized protein